MEENKTLKIAYDIYRENYKSKSVYSYDNFIDDLISNSDKHIKDSYDFAKKISNKNNVRNTFEDNIIEAYNKYLQIPLANITSLNDEENIYSLDMCVVTGLGIVDPNPHRHYTLLEFAYWLGKKQEIKEKFFNK